MIGKTAFIFPGQGSQYVGMGADLHRNFEVAAKTFDEANEALGFDLAKLCFEGDPQELKLTANTQPAVLACSVAAARVFQSEVGIEADYLAGHSVGEYAALVVAGSLSFAEALKLVQLRGKFMQESVAEGEGAMLAVSGVPVYLLEKWCDKHEDEVAISGYNSKAQLTLSGKANAVEALQNSIVSYGGKAIQLKVSAPFHSVLMQQAADRLLQELQNVSFQTSEIPVISNVNALPYADTTTIAALLSQQVVLPVQWVNSIGYLEEHGVRKMIELGPGKVLRNLLKRDTWLDVQGLEDSASLEGVVEKWVKKAPSLIDRCLGLIVSARNTNFSVEDYQSQVLDNYRKLEEMKHTLDAKPRQLNSQEETRVLQNFKTILDGKGLSIQEQQVRFRQLLNETRSNHLKPIATQIFSS
jgi:[acyl-carrier-protein] S-malonyltransferase